MAGSTCAPSERGKNSYQEPYSARSRSTQQRHRSLAVTSSRSGCCAERLRDLGRRGGREPGRRPAGRSSRSAVAAASSARRPAAGRGHAAAARSISAGALLEHQLDVDARRDLDRGVVPPGGDRVAPGLDGEGPRARRGRGDVRAPAVGARRAEAHAASRAPAALGVAQHDVRGDRVVALAEDGGGDLEGLADHRLGGPAPAVLGGLTSRMGMRPIIGTEPTHVAVLPAHTTAASLGASIVSTVKAIRRFTVRTVLPRAARAAGRARPQPPLVLAPADARACSRASTRGSVGARRRRPGRAARRARSATGSPRWPRTPTWCVGVGEVAGGPAATTWAETAGTRSARPRTALPRAIAYFSPEFGITAALPQYSRRPRHPGRRPPQGGQRPRRADHRRRPALPARLLPPVAVARGLAAGALPGARPQRAAAHAAARGRRRARSRSGSACPAAARCTPRSGRPRSAGCRCCCSTPTSRTTSRPSARSPTGSTAAAASTGCCRRCCSASAGCGRCAPTAG